MARGAKDDAEPAATASGERPGLTPVKKLSLGAILAVLVLSVVGRLALAGDAQGPVSGTATPLPGTAQGLVAQGAGTSGTPSEPEPAAPGSLEALLPVFTEGSFFALLGFAVGYTSRKIVKLALIFLAIFFAGLQILTTTGAATVDWGRMVELVNDLVLNLEENQTFTEVLTDRVPTVGAFVGGYLLGFRRG